MHFSAVAPPRGERGLKYYGSYVGILCDIVAPPRGERGLKWLGRTAYTMPALVAPPRGERGLKWLLLRKGILHRSRRSPSWGAWIEIAIALAATTARMSLPLVGSVD